MISQRLHTINVLRGVACLWVVWYHFTLTHPILALQSSGAYGWLGVPMFFVISGFIIPHTLALADYHLRDYGIFLLKRVVRLDPAYLVTIAGILILGYLDRFAPGFKGPSLFHPSLPQVFLHLGFLNTLFDYPWLNVVFWTLAVEAQYYLFIGLTFPALVSRNWYVRIGMLLVLAASALLLTSGKFFFRYSFLFMLGFLTFYYRSQHLKRWPFLASVAIAGLGAWYTLGLPTALAGVATACAIAFLEINSSIMIFLGSISYSLYLCHLPIGGRMQRLFDKFVPGTAGSLLGLAAAIGSSLVAAWLLHRIVERPSQLWSSAIGYRSRQVAPSAFAPRVG